MSYQSDIYTAIQASTALTALIGNRFFWDIADGTTAPPYIVAQTISTSGETDLSGGRAVSFPLVQFSCWARGKAEAIAIMSTFKTEMEGRNLPGTSNASLGFSGDQSSYDTATKLYGELYDYRVSAFTN